MAPDWARYQAAVGRKWEYYAPRFERFARGGWLSWNWAALFGTLAWLRYRRLYLWSWVYFFVSAPVLLFVYAVAVATIDPCARRLAPQAYDPWLYAIGVLALAGWILPPLFANRVYFHHVRARIESGKGSAPDPTGATWGALSLQGLVIVLMVMTIPNFGAYLYRSRVTEGVNAAGVLKEPAEAYRQKAGRWPQRVEEIAAKTSTRNVRDVSVVPGGGLRATFAASAERLEGRSVQWEPRVDGGSVTWSCRSVDLPDVCLPSICRRR